MKSTFQKRLQERMDELGFRQADLAERTGLSKSRISHYINGRYEAKQEALYLLAKALDVNEAWLMGHDVPKERSIAEKESDMSYELKLLDQISIRYGKAAVQALSVLNELNEEGQKKAVSALEDLSEIPKYRKDDDS